MLIDSHHHLWSAAESHELSWISGPFEQLRRSALPIDLDAVRREAQVDLTVVVEAGGGAAETRRLLAAASGAASVAAVVGWTDLSTGGLDSLLRLPGSDKLRAVRIAEQTGGPSWLDLTWIEPGLAALNRARLTLDVLAHHRHIVEVIALARTHPELSVVVNHLAKPPILGGRLDDWVADVTALAREPNVLLKVSGLVTLADWNAWRASDFVPFIDIVLDRFGPNRLMIGSDWPVCLVAGDYAAVMSAYEAPFEALTGHERAAVFAGTAAHAYRLEI